jgi:nitrile hydratase accessory protein
VRDGIASTWIFGKTIWSACEHGRCHAFAGIAAERKRTGLPRALGGAGICADAQFVERGCFTWKEWAEHLGAEIAAARSRGDDEDGSRYYEYWLAALEKLATHKGLVTATEMLIRKQDWDRAARATPHGKPIVLPDR